jgi:protein-disulfide isomerase
MVIRPIAMSCFFAPVGDSTDRARRFCGRVLLPLAWVAVLIAGVAAIHAQIGAPTATTKILDPSALHPPAGARIAIVEFADLQCPACAAANPALKAAVAQYKIPWIRHDFLIPSHNWSRYAAINARWFDMKSTALGDEYRDQIFASQRDIYNPGVLSQFTMNFAKNHNIQLPFSIDPQGTLAAAVDADNALGIRTGVRVTPTIFVVTSNSKGAPFIEVRDPQHQLVTTIDQALADTPPAKPALKKTAGK